ncbi:MAG: M1 family metallopeptidase [Saprospiraceae bacterium]|nr:M1 family metallopeptidase [Saprospiraceae bacterium]
MQAPAEEPLEIRNLDTLVVTAPSLEKEASIADSLPVYRATHKRTVDLLHTDLELSFDWAKEQVLGRAVLSLTPYNLDVSSVRLDAKNFVIHHIRDGLSGSPYNYTYQGGHILIELPRVVSEGDTISIEVDYTASPTLGSSASAAITSDQGLFFINADGNEASKPQQIWTQGETEFNSNWFPTIDKPNERQTHTIALTVEDRFTTLSNGELVASTMVGEGMRRDVWTMNQPHAPYLVMLGIGEFAVVDDSTSTVPVQYYVEPEYERDASAIFAHTPEMIAFFSRLTNTPYPWNKYSQIVVRDYVSGAMENTTAVIYGDQVQKHKRELIDDDNDYIVAHELIHHWFGNLVTCESWSNLTLNEGFANYGEYLWFEHKYGLDRAEHHRLEEMDGYLYEAETKRHPLIDFQYGDKEDMFDSHSYNKGGLVLHMLRKYLGDELFFESWEEYLKENAFQAVEVHHLRLAVEKISGEDMSWFFNQWFLSGGHPEIVFDSEWIASRNVLSLQFDQVQDVQNNLPIYRLPLEVLTVFADGSSQTHSLLLSERSQEVELILDDAPIAVIPDPGEDILAEIESELDAQSAALLYHHSTPYALRDAIVERIAGLEDSTSLSLLRLAMSDPFWSIRRKALNYTNWDLPGTPVDLLQGMAVRDPHSQVRADALMVLSLIAPKASKELMADGINDYDPYPVVGASIAGLFQIDQNLCLEKIDALKKEDQPDIVAAISGIYRQLGDLQNLDYFEEHMFGISGLQALGFYGNLQALMARMSVDQLKEWLQKCTNVATAKSANPYTRISAMRTLIAFFQQADQIPGLESSALKEMIDEVLAKETNQQVLSIYESLMGS